MQIELSLEQRAYDGKWVLWGKVPDPTLDLQDFIGRELLFPMRWVPLRVYDYIIDSITLDRS